MANMSSKVINEEAREEGENHYSSPVTRQPWMNDFLEKYRKWIFENYLVNKFVNLSEDDLKHVHNRGVEEVMKLFAEYKKSSTGNLMDSMNEPSLRAVLEKNFFWVRDFNKSLLHLGGVLQEIVKEGEENLKSKFTFDPNPNKEFLHDDLITSLTSDVIKEEIVKFHEKISEWEFGKIILSNEEKYNAILEHKLDKIGMEEGAKYVTARKTHIELKTDQCITAYKTNMEMAMAGKSLKEMQQIEDLHFHHCGKCLEVLVDEIGINALEHFRPLSFSFAQAFEDLMDKKKKDVKCQCLGSVREVFARRGIPYEIGSEADGKILAGIEKAIQDAIESTQGIVSKSAGLVDVSVTRINLDSSSKEISNMEEDTSNGDDSKNLKRDDSHCMDIS